MPHPNAGHFVYFDAGEAAIHILTQLKVPARRALAMIIPAMSDAPIVPIRDIQTRILVLRGQRVLLDEDLATFYGVETKALNQAIKRNADRFPPDFRFQLAPQEFANLKSQIVTSSFAHGGRRKLPSAFTEHGILMAATVLNSPRAVRLESRGQFGLDAADFLKRGLASGRHIIARIRIVEDIDQCAPGRGLGPARGAAHSEHP